MGYLPEAIRNYLLRLGWSHGDAEVISTEEAISWFSLSDVNKGAARIDFSKLENLNGHYINETPNALLLNLLERFLRDQTGEP
jgi:glutamyl-tRNA synthetase